MPSEILRPAPVPESLLLEFSDFVARQVGLSFVPKRWPDLLRGMTALAEELDFSDIESCMRSLMRAPLSRSQVELLAGQFAVGETYFFRDPEMFSSLEHCILPPLIAERRDSGKKRLRIWSAGCCSGEEAYSIAILLNRLIPDVDTWNITILGTDFNPQFLEKAKRGVYREWSFRNNAAAFRRHNFTEPEPGSYALAPHIKRLVEFEHLNLACDVYPALENNTDAMDLILCRNVLMYFEPQQIVQTVRKLHHSLVDGGWLVVSATEAASDLFSEFVAVRVPGRTYYRKDERKEERGKPAADVARSEMARLAWAEASADKGRTGFEAWLAGQEKNEEPLCEPTRQPLAAYRLALTYYEQGAYEKVLGILNAATYDGPDALALLARACANCGRLTEAAAWCQAAITADKCSPGLRYLQAVILEEQGKVESAAAALKRALYLDQDFVLAHYALGNLYRRQDKPDQAERHYSHALTLLQGYPAHGVVPESEGMVTGRLIDIIQSRAGVA